MYYEGTAEDITERKRTERRLAVQYAVTRILAEALDLDPAQAISHILEAVSEHLGWDWSALWQVDRQARLLRCVEVWHRPAVQMPGFEADSWRRTFDAGIGLPGRVWASGQPTWIPDVLQDADFARASIAVKEGLHAAAAFPILLGNEILGVIECCSRDILAPDDDMLRLFMTVGSEIGQLIERARIEEERKQLAKHIRLLLESTGEGIYGLDREGRCTFMNTSAAVMLGYHPEEVLGQNLHALAHHTRLDGSAYPFAECLIHSAVQTGQGCHVDTEIFWRRGGTAFPVDYTSYPILEEGVIKGAVVAFTDLTERKRTEEELQRQREALYQAEKVATMGQLLAGVAHELNNPLSVVLGQALMMKQFAIGDPLAPRIEQISSAAERCVRVIKNFLALARQQPPGRQRVDLNRLIREAVELLAYPLQVATIEVHCDLSADLPTLWADADQLHQVVVNLISNAHQAMRETPPPRRLTLTTRADPLGTHLELQVADTGPGIPIELQTRIFEPFFTTKPPGIGTGIGLSLCQGIVESHGGSIRVESQCGPGAVFRVMLPIQVIPAAMPQAVFPETLPSIRGKAILIVDDEPDIANVLVELLTLDGHRVETASNGVMALSMIQKHAYDLILSDVRMPELSGPELYRQVEQHHRHFLHRFIFLTGDTLSPEIRVFLDQTGSLYISKPFSLEEIRRVVEQALSSPK
jgi:PAS domain S-box-containing protein